VSLYEYWIGKGIDLRKLWADYEGGAGYMNKFEAMDVHLIQFTFKNPPSHLPLFNLEVVLKTLKAYFHEIKLLSLSQSKYDEAGPLFVYEINRGSSIWSFLGGLRHLVLFGTTLADEQLKNLLLDNTIKELEILDKKVDVLKKHFGSAVEKRDFQQFMQAQKPDDLKAAINKLFGAGIGKIEISKESFKGNIDDTKKSLINIKKELEEKN
jgi:hypothetical protein